MRGVYCNGERAGLQRDLPAPRVAEGETLLNVRAVGICDTDLQLARGYLGFHGILGHEFLATTDTGQRVTAEINNSCQNCPVCLGGLPHHCPRRSVLGIFQHDGAMADQVAVPTRNLHIVPDSIDDRQAVFIEPLAAAFRITEQIALNPRVKFAVVGDGKLGLLCAWVARLSGARVHLIGKHPEKRALAEADVTTHALEDVPSLERSFDVVADCTGSTTGLSTALRLVAPCGTVVLKTTVAGEYAINLAPIVIDEVRVIGSRCGPFPPAIAALTTREIDVNPLIGAVYSIDEADAAFQAAAAKGAKKILLEVAR